MNAVFDDFGYEHRSDNVVDAYILAKIAFSIFVAEETGELNLSTNKAQVIQSIIQVKADMKMKA
ncbi:MAG: hypothetical protein ACQEWF_01820 [Bacillota bacterium]